MFLYSVYTQDFPEKSFSLLFISWFHSFKGRMSLALSRLYGMIVTGGQVSMMNFPSKWFLLSGNTLFVSHSGFLWYCFLSNLFLRLRVSRSLHLLDSSFVLARCCFCYYGIPEQSVLFSCSYCISRFSSGICVGVSSSVGSRICNSVFVSYFSDRYFWVSFWSSFGFVSFVFFE